MIFENDTLYDKIGLSFKKQRIVDMKKEKNMMREAKPQKTKLKMTFAILCLAVLCIAALYLMINYATEYIFLGVTGLGILCLVYIVTDLSFKMRRENELIYEKQYENVYKAQKVSYVFMKQSIMEMEKLLNRIKDNTEVPADELIEAQKAVGKITIQRNKENTASIINSNEKVIHHVISLEDKMKDVIRIIEESANQRSLETVDSQQKMIEKLEKNQLALTEEINKLTEQIRLQNHEVLDAVQKSVSENAAILEEHIASEISVLAEEASVIKEGASGIPGEPAGSEEIAVPEEAFIPKENERSEEVFIPENNEVLEETFISEKNKASEEVVIPEQREESEEVFISEENGSSEEPAAQENTESLEDIAASGKMMTPEEIAALLEETTAAMEPQEPIKEEKPAAPNASSDPGHIMTPEEIAALLANM